MENVFKSKYSKESTFIESKNFPNDSYANVNIRIIVGGILGFFSVYNRDTIRVLTRLCVSFIYAFHLGLLAGCQLLVWEREVGAGGWE